MTLSYKSEKIHGAGLGLRPAFLREFAADPAKYADFFEVAPENWIHVQGKLRDPFEQAASHMPMVCHGLSLNLGGPKPLNLTLVGEIQQLLSLDNVAYYNEYLSYCGDEGHLYDLLLIPLTAQAITHVSDRIKQVQDALGQQMAPENVPYYCTQGQQMREIEFLLGVLDAADFLSSLNVNSV